MSNYFPTIAWGTICRNVLPEYITGTFQLNSFTVDVYPIDSNEPGAGSLDCAVNDYVLDYLGFPYIITAISTISEGKRLVVYDINERSISEMVIYGPYSNRIGYVYRPINGAVILSQSQLLKLDTQARDRINNFEKGVIWENRGIALYDGTKYNNITLVELGNNLATTSSLEVPWNGGLAYILGVNVAGTDNGFLIKGSNGEIVNSGYQFSTLNTLADASDTLISSTLAIKTYIDAMASGGNFLDAVIRMVIDNTFDPGASPTTGDRYILETLTIHANFGTIAGVGLHDIVEYSASAFVVIFDASAATTPATVTVGTDKNLATNHQWTYNTTDDVWVDRGAIGNHNDLSLIDGGTTGQYFHLTSAQHTDLTDAGDSILHYHASDRDRANHTGSQLYTTITDFIETVQDTVASQIQNDSLSNMIWSYNDTTGLLTPTISVSGINYWSKSGSNLTYSTGKILIGASVDNGYTLDVTGTGKFTSSITGVTESLSDNSTKLASTAYVKGQNYITLASLSSIATGLSYSNTTGIFSITSGYVIPTTTEQTQWDTAYTHSLNNNQAHSDYLKNNADDTTSGILTASQFITPNSTTIGGILLKDSLDRTGLLEINRKGTTTWSGIQVKYSVTALWSFMGTETQYGLYDDVNAKWSILSTKNAQTSLYYNGGVKLNTTNTGIAITGQLTSDGTGNNSFMGNVGIGITTPLNPVHIEKSDGTPQLRLSMDGSHYSTFYTNSAGGTIINTVGGGSGYIIFDIDSSEKMRILSNGNIGIGINAPISKIHIYESTTSTGIATGLTIEQSSTGDAQLQYLLTEGQRWVTGIDNSDSDSFKIGRGVDWATGVDIKISTAGAITLGSLAGYIKGTAGALSASTTIPETDLSFTDVTTNNSSTTKHGFLPKLTGVTTVYLNGNGSWTTPPDTTVAYGADNQIPFINTTNNGFEYSSVLTWDSYRLSAAYGDNLYVGSSTTGSTSATSIRNVALGVGAGVSLSGGDNNSLIGWSAGATINTGSSNIAIGGSSAANLSSGTYNTIIGANSTGQGVNGNYNIAIGSSALVYSSTNTYSNNIAIGQLSGGLNTGDSNIFLGNYSGRYETGATTSLYIDNLDRTTEALGKTNSLIYGTFNSTPSSQLLRFNSKVETPQLSSGYKSQQIRRDSSSKELYYIDDAYSALTTNSSVSWDASTGLNKTWSINGNYSLTLTNFASGMFGVVVVTVTSTATITIVGSGVTFKGNGSLVSLAAGEYNLAWNCISATRIDWNIALYV